MSEIEITNLWLVRHGEPCASVRGRCYGKLDVGLGKNGLRQVQAAAESLRAEPLTAIYASPRRRTRESAEVLAHGRACPVEVEERFAELNFGDFEGRSYDEIAVSHPDLYRQWMEQPTEMRFPNGESFEQMRMRVLRASGEILARHRGESVAIVSHGGVNRILLANALGMAARDMFRLAQGYAAINHLRFLGEYPSVECVNLCGAGQS